MKVAWLIVLLAAGLGGCDVRDVSMSRQKKLRTYAPSELWTDGSSARTPPRHTIRSDHDVNTVPPAVTSGLLERGREQYDIFCTPCHGFDGRGEGVVVARGFPKPPSYLSPRLMKVDAQHIYDVITSGYGVMYPYGARIAPADRWAIIAYIRALQHSQQTAAAGLGEPAP